MISRSVLLLLWCTGVTHGNLALVTLYKDRPLFRAKLSETAELECCYEVKGVTVVPTWVVSVIMTNGTKRYMETTVVAVDNQRVTLEKAKDREGLPCHTLRVREVDMNDSGLYRCLLNHTSLYSSIYTHGTFLQVYKPMPKFLDISEKAKNHIILTEAILLLLCVLVPGLPLLCKAKKHKKQENKNKGEEENIYEGLNLDDLDSTYHQIQRSQVCSPYQDVGNVLGEDIQLEKP